MKSFIGTMAAALLCAACGSSSSGASSASGTLDGKSVSVGSAVFDTVTTTNQEGDPESVLAVVLSNIGNLCEAASSSNEPSGSWNLIELGIVTSSTLGTGTFDVYVPSSTTNGSAPVAQAIGKYNDSTGASSTATSGSITITSLTGSNASGTYSLDFTSNTDGSSLGTLSGSFSASQCNLPTS